MSTNLVFDVAFNLELYVTWITVHSRLLSSQVKVIGCLSHPHRCPIPCNLRKRNLMEIH